jgi:hypothetical protein
VVWWRPRGTTKRDSSGSVARGARGISHRAAIEQDRSPGAPSARRTALSVCECC